MERFSGPGGSRFEMGVMEVSDSAALAAAGVSVAEVFAQHGGEGESQPWFHSPDDLLTPEPIRSGYRLDNTGAVLWVVTSVDFPTTGVFLHGGK